YNLAVIRNVENLLDKLTANSTNKEMNRVIQEITVIEMFEENVKDVARVIYERAINDDKFSLFYADLCKAKMNKEIIANNGTSIIHRELTQLTHGMFYDNSTSNGTHRNEKKMRRLGNVIFLGNLYEVAFFTHKTIH
ncbi:hypothetical protein PFISCL1PPCAC_12272, partial [Pristionchus fissidentatus]